MKQAATYYPVAIARVANATPVWTNEWLFGLYLFVFLYLGILVVA